MNVSTEPDVSTVEVSSAAGSAPSRRWLTLHALAFVIATGINAIIDAADGGGWRIQWMLLGWGIGLACHAALVLSRPSPGDGPDGCDSNCSADRPAPDSQRGHA